jgi:phosphatidylinositol alpha-1,6-mannosyltransferase
MKVLLLTWDFPPVRGGIQTWMLELARRLPDAKVRVLAPAVQGDRAFDATSGCRVTRLGSARLGRIPWLIQLCATTLWECITRRPDVIVCGHVTTAPAALLARRVLGIPYVVFTYGYEIRRKRWKRLLRFLLRNAKLVVACSDFTRNAVLALGVAVERTRILYPGVDTQHFTPDTRHLTPDTTRRNGRGTLLTVARLAELYKGHDTTIRALPLVRAKCPDVRYVIAGDGPLRDYLGRVAESVGVEREVRFLGEVTDDELPDLYRACDAFVLLSRESPSKGGAEGFGIVCIEAGACGKPVVAGRSGGLVDAVDHDKSGLLVDPQDIGAVAEALVSVLTDSSVAERLGKEGRRRVLERFTWDQVIADARKVFEEALED